VEKLEREKKKSVQNVTGEACDVCDPIMVVEGKTPVGAG